MIRNPAKYFFLFSFFSCIFINTSYAAEQPKTLPPAETLVNSKWTEYTNSEYKFKISYPAVLKIVNADKAANYSSYHYQANAWAFNSDHKGKVIVIIPTIDLNYSAQVHIGVSKDPEAIKNCLTLKNIATSTEVDSTIVINHTTFHVVSFNDVGMSQFTNGVIFRTIHNNQCFSIEQIQNGFAPGVVDKSPNDVSEAVANGYYDLAGKIIKTFRFTD